MAGHKARRIAKDLADIRSDSASSIFAETVGDSITDLRGSFKGPSGTPYEGGTYEVSIKIPNEYPFKPPVMKFMTKIWHPNISSQTSLLSSPEPKDPQDAVVAQQLIKNPKEFERQAREWAVKYAGAPKSLIGESSGGSTAESIEEAEKESKEREAAANIAVYDGYNKDLIDRFVLMGFDVERVVEAFNYVGIDRNGGQDYELEEAYMGDITARLLGEP
ncbi:Ubiquitin-conjugating enzyme E2 1 [Exophiala xenobiotica]|nr:Ubiquitin-conjugating enzyme E2 1 [Exophiala xenobiotica]KAK5543269.1 Ubiquitin-conjugating enzyme E2 1 [Chaetothyriales sp. CCFEE 6169]KAK5212074.1 Ubiquitin-conjugating enzyme E2 1 [Exophiala xenobiotica]KAK5217751.1 Ubiquitin-conjugating enzyme E2 1 [Exophiala xenobiotica]KAK5235168.1 Ubiquitin-conjugating enzyme E2 1 [Exophiala xenobiotica]